MSSLFGAAVALLLAGCGGSGESDFGESGPAAACGAWEFSQSQFHDAGREIAAGKVQAADARLARAARILPMPYREWAWQFRRRLAAAQVEPPAAGPPQDFDDLFPAPTPAPQSVREPIASDDPFAPAPTSTPAPLPAAAAPATGKRGPAALSLRLARVCHEMRAYPSAAELYWRGIDSRQFTASEVCSELLACLSRYHSPAEQWQKLDRLIAQEKNSHWFETAFRVAMEQRKMTLQPTLEPGEPLLEWGRNPARHVNAGLDRLEFLQPLAHRVTSDEDHLRLGNAVAQALWQIGDEAGCDAWEDRLLTQFRRWPEQCTAIRMRRGERLLQSGRWPAALIQFRLVTERYPATTQSWAARYRVAEIYEQRRYWLPAAAEYERLIAAGLSEPDEEEPRSVLSLHSLHEIAVRCAECREQAGELTAALGWAQFAQQADQNFQQRGWLGNPAGDVAERIARLNRKLTDK